MEGPKSAVLNKLLLYISSKLTNSSKSGVELISLLRGYVVNVSLTLSALIKAAAAKIGKPHLTETGHALSALAWTTLETSFPPTRICISSCR
ncbi:hypothetical protein VN97_g2612 [Penicillium thymicola]|uniref:Uncharacterized protein n=1 Tax=Penicillium thymicola TaxID=293382 RepID=A0AAI9TPJ1_PENTH|nr:hypothetical protein VN97_g2612 [Penicillium thymicola]